MARRRSRRGNGGANFSATEGEELNDAVESEIAVVDADGNPIDDDAVYEPDEEISIAEPDPEPEDESALAALQKNYDEIQQQAQQTQQRLQQAENDLAQRDKDADATTKALIAQTKASTEAARDAAKMRYVEALEAGEFAAAADAQVELTTRTTELAQITQIEEEYARQQPTQRQPQRQTQQQAPKDWNTQVDTYISQKLTPAQQEFAKKHRDRMFPEGDTSVLQEANALGNIAARKYGADTPEFFDYLEQHLGFKELPQDNPPEPQAKPAQKRQPVQKRPAGAPAGRTPQGQRRTVMLSAQERQMAQRLDMTPASYAKHKQAALDGAKDPDYKGPRYSKDDPAIVGHRG